MTHAVCWCHERITPTFSARIQGASGRDCAYLSLYSYTYSYSYSYFFLLPQRIYVVMCTFPCTFLTRGSFGDSYAISNGID